MPSVTLAAELEVVTENWKPYNYEENKSVKGVSTEIVEKVLERANITYSIKVYPWARAYMMAQKKQNVLIYTMIRIPSREGLFKWVRPLGKGGTTSLYRLKKNEHINPTTVEGAKKYKVVTNLNSMDHLWLKENGFKKLEVPSKVKLSINMFFGERSDMIAFNDSTMAEEFKNAGFDSNDVVQVMPLFETLPYMAVSRSTSDNILKKLQKAYDSLIEENEISLVH
ncbi:MAG: transporter substrate-binding domain-containing protein [Sneathiella sp.]